MKVLEVRRHTMRTKPELSISAKGAALAKLVAQTRSEFGYVVTSDLDRAIQTATAMGYTVNRTISDLGFLPQEIFEHVGWPVPFAQISNALKDKKISQYAQKQLSIWLSIVLQLPDHQTALIVTHGLMIELAMVASIPFANHSSWGAAIGYCEGISLSVKNNKIIDYKILRVAKEHYNANN